MCVRNAEATVEAQLTGLVAQTFTDPWEVVVVDNGCSDATIDIVRRYADLLPALRTEQAFDQTGLGYARNVGLRAARGAVVAFCDGDDVVRPGWLEALVRACPDSGIVGGDLNLDTLNDEVARYWFGPSPTASGLPRGHGYLTYVIGGNFAIRRDTFLAVGGCDQRFLSASDDVDLSWRVQLAGYPITFAAEAVVDYRLRNTIPAAARQRHAYGRSEAILYSKHRPAMRRQLKQWVRVGWFLVSRCHHIVRGPALRGRWTCVAAYHAGRLRGSWDQRVWFP